MATSTVGSMSDDVVALADELLNKFISLQQYWFSFAGEANVRFLKEHGQQAQSAQDNEASRLRIERINVWIMALIDVRAKASRQEYDDALSLLNSTWERAKLTQDIAPTDPPRYGVSSSLELALWSLKLRDWITRLKSATT